MKLLGFENNVNRIEILLQVSSVHVVSVTPSFIANQLSFLDFESRETKRYRGLCHANL